MTNISSRKDAKSQRETQKQHRGSSHFFNADGRASRDQVPCNSDCLLGVLASLRDKHILTQSRKEKHKRNTVAVLIFSTQRAGVERPRAMQLRLLKNHSHDSSALSNDRWMAPGSSIMPEAKHWDLVDPESVVPVEQSTRRLRRHSSSERQDWN